MTRPFCVPSEPPDDVFIESPPTKSSLSIIKDTGSKHHEIVVATGTTITQCDSNCQSPTRKIHQQAPKVDKTSSSFSFSRISLGVNFVVKFENEQSSSQSGAEDSEEGGDKNSLTSTSAWTTPSSSRRPSESSNHLASTNEENVLTPPPSPGATVGQNHEVKWDLFTPPCTPTKVLSEALREGEVAKNVKSLDTDAASKENFERNPETTEQTSAIASNAQPLGEELDITSLLTLPIAACGKCTKHAIDTQDFLSFSLYMLENGLYDEACMFTTPDANHIHPTYIDEMVALVSANSENLPRFFLRFTSAHLVSFVESSFPQFLSWQGMLGEDGLSATCHEFCSDHSKGHQIWKFRRKNSNLLGRGYSMMPSQKELAMEKKMIRIRRLRYYCR